MILSIDPGGTTGIAMLQRDGSFTTGQISGGAEGMWQFLYDTVQTGHPVHPVDAVVIENFTLRPGAKSTQMDAVWIIGAVKYLCRLKKIPLYIQTPAQAKSFATNEKLKAVGWYAVGEDHGRDAARHMLVWLCGQNLRPPMPVSYELLRLEVLDRLVS